MVMTEEKSYKIQVLRGLSIIAVVMIHNTPGGLMQVWCRPFINFGVGCFLFLSGMLSSADKWHPYKRIVKIIIPYVIWSLIYVIIGHYKQPAQIPVIYIKQLITANAAKVMYYVFIYCEFQLLIPAIDKLARSKYKWIGFAVSPIEIIVMRLTPLVTGIEWNRYIQIVIRVSCLGWFTYFYLGYLLGNGLLKIRRSTSRLAVMWAGAMALQILEGYLYYSTGKSNCGTQVKLSAILSGVLFVMIAYQYIESDRQMTYKCKILHVLGDCSFGIFYSHLAVMAVLDHIPYYSVVIIYPFNAIVTITISCLCVLLGRKILGRYGKYLAL